MILNGLGDPIPGPWASGYVLPSGLAPPKTPAKSPSTPAPAPAPASGRWGTVALVGAGVGVLALGALLFRRRRRESNPSRAARDYQGFHWGRKPDRIDRVRVAPRPRRLVELGTLEQITYSTVKGRKGKLTDYVHDFGRRKPVLAMDPKNKRLHIVGGAYRVEDRGIVG